jgi:hypothetical protein
LLTEEGGNTVVRGDSAAASIADDGAAANGAVEQRRGPNCHARAKPNAVFKTAISNRYAITNPPPEQLLGTKDSTEA